MSSSTENAGEKGGQEDEGRDWYVELAYPIIKFVVAVGVLVLLWRLVNTVDAAHQVTVPLPGGAEISMAGLMSSVLTLILMIAIIAFASSFGRVLHDGLDVGVLETLSKLGGIAIALVFAYFMFAWVTETFEGYEAHYDIAFLVAGIVIVGWLGLVLYSNVDDLVEAIA